MRCQTLRSVLRGMIAAGILFSAQSGLLQASWKDRLQPYAASCFLHDLHWDTPYFGNQAIAANLAPHAISDEEAYAKEHAHCLAAAKNFELKSQFQAAWEMLQDMQYQTVGMGQKLFRDSASARELLVVSLEQGSLTLVQWIKMPSSLPVTALVSQDDSRFEDNRFDDEWNCGDWAHSVAQNPVEATIRLPERKGGNIFVYTIENDLAYMTDDATALCNPVSIESAVAASHVWQIGVDPVCPELNQRNAPVSWRDSFIHSSVCCPVHSDIEAIGNQAEPASIALSQRPPVLEAASDVEIDGFSESSNCEAEKNATLSTTMATSLYAIEEQYERKSRISSIDAARIIDSIGVSDWTGWMAKRFQFSGLSLNMLEAKKPESLFSIEELIVPSKTRAWIVETLQASIPTIPEEITTGRTEEDVFADSAPAWNSNPETISIVPESSEVSRYLANRIRNVGVFLIDFASQLELQADQVEIARQETHQR